MPVGVRPGGDRRLIAGVTGIAHSTVWKVLRRHGLSRRQPGIKEPANRYEWPCAGDLLHMDTSRYARFLRPGHRVTGDRSQQSRQWMRPETRVGYDYVHAVVDDHSRLAYVELHPDETAATVTGFVERALAYLAEHGITTRRLMTDNAFAYVKNRSLRELLAAHRIRHHHDSALPATHQRQSRALPPNNGPRMGLRPHLPITPRTQPGPATLAQQLQPPQTTQLDRRPTPDQPHLQPAWAGQLATGRAGRARRQDRRASTGRGSAPSAEPRSRLRERRLPASPDRRGRSPSGRS